jgi:hypothetical protein
MDNCAIGFLNFAEILSWFELHPNGVALSSGQSYFSYTQFPYQGFECPNQGNGCPSSWFDAHNFHISSLRVQTMKAGIRTSEFWMCDLPYWWARLGGNPHRPDSCSDLPIFCVLERNPTTCRTPSVVQTCYWNVRTDASWNSSKLLDKEEGPDGKFSSSEQMMLWTVGRSDGISRRPDGCKGSDFSDL